MVYFCKTDFVLRAVLHVGANKWSFQGPISRYTCTEDLFEEFKAFLSPPPFDTEALKFARSKLSFATWRPFALFKSSHRTFLVGGKLTRS